MEFWKRIKSSTNPPLSVAKYSKKSPVSAGAIWAPMLVKGSSDSRDKTESKLAPKIE